MTANAHCFAQAHWRVIASGLDTERWFNEGQGAGTGGILNPQPTRLPAGQYYYRFASSSSSLQAQHGGGWWLDFENFRLVQRFAEENGYTLREAARLTLALPYAWTRVDRLLRALLLQPLRAYTGLGKPALEPAASPPHGAAGRPTGALVAAGTRWVPTQHVAVRQLYVPGLCQVVEGQPLYQQVFAQPVVASGL